MDFNSRFRGLCRARRDGRLTVFLPRAPPVVGLLELKNCLPLIDRGMRQQHTELPEEVAASDGEPPLTMRSAAGEQRGSPTGARGRLNNQRRVQPRPLGPMKKYWSLLNVG
jgi:hypothetical protein